jgi:hypothetical protein
MAWTSVDEAFDYDLVPARRKKTKLKCRSGLSCVYLDPLEFTCFASPWTRYATIYQVQSFLHFLIAVSPRQMAFKSSQTRLHVYEPTYTVALALSNRVQVISFSALKMHTYTCIRTCTRYISALTHRAVVSYSTKHRCTQAWIHTCICRQHYYIHAKSPLEQSTRHTYTRTCTSTWFYIHMPNEH